MHNSNDFYAKKAKKKFTRGFEFGQFEMVKVNTITV